MAEMDRRNAVSRVVAAVYSAVLVPKTAQNRLVDLVNPVKNLWFCFVVLYLKSEV